MGKKKWEKYFDEHQDSGEDIFSNPDAMDAFIASIMEKKRKENTASCKHCQSSTDENAPAIESFIFENAIGDSGRSSNTPRHASTESRPKYDTLSKVPNKNSQPVNVWYEDNGRGIRKLTFKDWLGNSIVVPVVENNNFGVFDEDSLETLVEAVSDYSTLSMAPFCVYDIEELVQRFTRKGITTLCESRFCFLTIDGCEDRVLAYYIAPEYSLTLGNITESVNLKDSWEGTLMLSTIQLSKMDSFRQSVSDFVDVDVMLAIQTLYFSEENGKRKELLESIILNDDYTKDLIANKSSDDFEVLIEKKEDIMSGIAYNIASFINGDGNDYGTQSAQSDLNIEEEYKEYEEYATPFENPGGYYVRNDDSILHEDSVSGGALNDDNPFRGIDASSRETISATDDDTGAGELLNDRTSSQVVEVVQETTTSVTVTERTSETDLSEGSEGQEEEQKEEREEDIRKYMVQGNRERNHSESVSQKVEEKEEDDSLVINTIRV